MLVHLAKMNFTPARIAHARDPGQFFLGSPIMPNESAHYVFHRSLFEEMCKGKNNVKESPAESRSNRIEQPVLRQLS